MKVGNGEIMYLSLHRHHQNDSCIKTGSDESHFNVSFTVKDKVTGQCPQTTIFEEKGEPKRIRTEISHKVTIYLMLHRHHQNDFCIKMHSGVIHV